MAREFQNSDLQMWEAFASTGEHGFPDSGRIVFRCRTDRDQRPRFVDIEGDKSDAEARILDLSRAELKSLLSTAQPLA